MMIKRYLLVISLMLFGMSNIQAQNNKKDDKQPEQVIIMSESDLINAVTRMIQETRRDNYSSQLKSKMIREKFNSVTNNKYNSSNADNTTSTVSEDRIARLEDQVRQLTATVNALRNPNSPQVVVLDNNKREKDTVAIPASNSENMDSLQAELNRLVQETKSLKGKIKSNQPQDLEKSQYEGMTKSVYFAHDKANLSASALQTINSVVEILKNDPRLEIMIKGFASQVGNSLYNQNLSLRRADNVKQSFVVKGIAPGRVLTTYHGEDVSDTSEAESRRVDLIILDTRK